MRDLWEIADGRQLIARMVAVISYGTMLPVTRQCFGRAPLESKESRNRRLGPVYE